MGLLDSFGFSDIELWRSEDMQLVQVRHAGLCPAGWHPVAEGCWRAHTACMCSPLSATVSMGRPLPTAQHHAPGCLPLTLARVVAS